MTSLRAASVGVLWAAVLAVGCGSTGQGPGPNRGQAKPGFERTIDATVAILPTVGTSVEAMDLPEPSAIEGRLLSELFASRLDRVRGVESGAGLRAVVRRRAEALARGDRVVPADYARLRERMEPRYALFSWVDERTVRGTEGVRSDLEPTDIRADDGLASYVAIEGRLEARIVDLEAGVEVWSMRRDYETPHDYDGNVDRADLERERDLAAIDVVRALDRAWNVAPD